MIGAQAMETMTMAKTAAAKAKPAPKTAKAPAKAPAAKAVKAKAPAKAPAAKPVFKQVEKPILSLTDFVKVLAERHELPKAKTKALVDELFAETGLALKAGRKVRLSGFGVIQVRARAARMGRNPATGEPIKIKASKRIAFRVAKDFKDGVL